MSLDLTFKVPGASIEIGFDELKEAIDSVVTHAIANADEVELESLLTDLRSLRGFAYEQATMVNAERERRYEELDDEDEED